MWSNSHLLYQTALVEPLTVIKFVHNIKVNSNEILENKTVAVNFGQCKKIKFVFTL